MNTSIHDHLHDAPHSVIFRPVRWFRRARRICLIAFSVLLILSLVAFFMSFFFVPFSRGAWAASFPIVVRTPFHFQLNERTLVRAALIVTAVFSLYGMKRLKSWRLRHLDSEFIHVEMDSDGQGSVKSYFLHKKENFVGKLRPGSDSSTDIKGHQATAIKNFLIALDDSRTFPREGFQMREVNVATSQNSTDDSKDPLERHEVRLFIPAIYYVIPVLIIIASLALASIGYLSLIFAAVLFLAVSCARLCGLLINKSLISISMERYHEYDDDSGVLRFNRIVWRLRPATFRLHSIRDVLKYRPVVVLPEVVYLNHAAPLFALCKYIEAMSHFTRSEFTYGTSPLPNEAKAIRAARQPG